MNVKKIKSLKFFFIIYLITSIINEINGFKCGSDFLEEKVGVINITHLENKNQENIYEDFSPIKIIVDYSNFNKTDSMTEETLSHAKLLIEDTIKEIEKFLGIQHRAINLRGYNRTIKEYCQITEIGKDYETYLIDNDVIVFPLFDESIGSNTLAAARYCLISNTNYRPIAGVLYINPWLSFNKKNTELYMKYLLIHEITHILVFSYNLFQRLGMINVDNETSIVYINSPKVLSKAKEHFNCSSLKGLPLENQGRAGAVGSHWETRYMLGDYMISNEYSDNVISDITLAVFEDSGYYRVKYYSGGLFKFGKNKGCDFFDKKCIIDGIPIFDEFCVSSNQPKCSPSRISKGRCQILNYTSIPAQYQYFENPNIGGFLYADYCPVSYSSNDDNNYFPTNCQFGISSLSEYGEKIGNNSFCFISSLIPYYFSTDLEVTTHAICYRVGCNKNTRQIIVYIGSLSVNCPTDGGNVTFSNFRGRIICPKYSELCNTDTTPLCNEMFDCLNRQIKSDYNEKQKENFTIFRSKSSFINLFFILRINLLLFIMMT